MLYRAGTKDNVRIWSENQRAWLVPRSERCVSINQAVHGRSRHRRTLPALWIRPLVQPEAPDHTIWPPVWIQRGGNGYNG
jgi:hypothetical protein